jgi:predicted amidophosphoribosyltransferase
VLVKLMAYCSNCGEKIPKDAYFCPKCGTKAVKGAETNVAAPSDELRDAFAKMSQELEKAFTIAAKEMHAAFQTARENIQKSLYKEPIVCPNCGEKNSSSAAFCFKCGKKLEPK